MSEQPKSITGRGPMRDTLILCNALAYAIITIERLPQEQQEWSNKEDMKKALDTLAANFLGPDYFMKGAKWHLDGEMHKVPLKEEI